MPWYPSVRETSSYLAEVTGRGTDLADLILPGSGIVEEELRGKLNESRVTDNLTGFLVRFNECCVETVWCSG